jgi:hypothetical protein
MIVVTGAPRTGTSMMMQTLKILGYPVVGDKFSEVNHSKKHNPKGYYELNPIDISSGVKDDKYKGKAVKLFAQGLMKTVEKHIDKLIVCNRYQPDSIKSFHKLILDSDVPIKKTIETASTVVRHNADIAKKYAKICGKPVLNISFIRMLNTTEKVIEELCEFLEIEPTEDQKKEAYNNIIRG